MRTQGPSQVTGGCCVRCALLRVLRRAASRPRCRQVEEEIIVAWSQLSMVLEEASSFSLVPIKLLVLAEVVLARQWGSTLVQWGATHLGLARRMWWRC